jgi:tetratricopeptide (TPR) repeat protein
MHRAVQSSGLSLGLLLLAAAAGCRSFPQFVEADAYYFQNQPERLLEIYGRDLEQNGPSAPLGTLKMLSAALLLQDWKAAESLALEASTLVNIYLANQKGERDALSAFGRERDKPFKGEPHEQAMADFYLGLVRYRAGDFEGALSCFRSALDKDRGSYLLPIEAPQARRGRPMVRRYLYESDYATFELFAALCWERLGEREEALEAVARAKKHRPQAAQVIDAAFDPENNVIVVIEAGRAPAKRAAGLRGSLLTYDRELRTAVSEVLLDGRPLAFAVTDDLHYQATTLGGRGVDELNRVKAERQQALETAGLATTLTGAFLASAGRRNPNLRTAGLVGMGAGIATMIFAATAFDPAADTRAWNLLPGLLVVAAGRAAPGPGHRLNVRAAGPLGATSQEWEGVPIAEDANLLHIRLLPGRRGGVWGGPAPTPAAPPSSDVPPPNL